MVCFGLRGVYGLNRRGFLLIERELLAHKVARQIISMIKSGNLRPGDQLPSERELATLMGVGRPAVREALRALQMLRIVEVRHGNGTYVSSLDPATLAEPYDLFLSLGSMSLDHLFEARRVIEVGVAALAAEVIDEQGIEKLKACVGEARQASDNPGRFLELDMKLHSLIVEATRNPVLKSIMNSISGLLRASRELTVVIPGVRDRVVVDHERIVEAIEGRDPAGAAACMAKHLDDVRCALHRICAGDDGNKEPVE